MTFIYQCIVVGVVYNCYVSLLEVCAVLRRFAVPIMSTKLAFYNHYSVFVTEFNGAPCIDHYTFLPRMNNSAEMLIHKL